MARVRWSKTRLPKYIDSMWSNTEDWQEIRRSPELVSLFGAIGQSWVADLNAELHQAQARRQQPIEDGYKFAINMDSDRIRMRIWTFTARAMAHEAKHQSILRLMNASGFDVKGKRRRSSGPRGGSGAGTRGRGGGGGPRPGGGKPRSRPNMDPGRERRLRRILTTLDALSKDSGASESEQKLARERARRVRSELGE